MFNFDSPKKWVIRWKAVCSVRSTLSCTRGAVRHLPWSEGKFTASSLTLNMHLTAVGLLDKLLGSSNSYWYTVIKNKCWSIHLKVNLSFFMPDWLALWKINGAWFSYAQSQQTHRELNSQNLLFNHLLRTSKFFYFFIFYWSTLETAKSGREKPLICFSNTVTFLAASWYVFAKGMVEWGRRPCSLWRGVFVCVGEVGSVSHNALPFPFLFPPKHPSVPKGSDLSDWPYAR